MKKLLLWAIALTGTLAAFTPSLKPVSAENPAPPAGEQLVLDSTVLSVTTVSSGLAVPWDIAWGPDGAIWFTEQRGFVGRLDPATGKRKTLLRVPDVFFKRSSGLLGMAVGVDKPTGATQVYLVYTYRRDSVVTSKLVRYTYASDTLTAPKVLLDGIPGNDGHNGARVSLAPDGTILLSTGDAIREKNAQDVTSLSGKILRLNPDGSVPADNPVPGRYAWSWGHRNAQGLCVAANGRVYASEHGPANDDEVNLIERGRNYGWPDVMGISDQPEEAEPYQTRNIRLPLKWWTPTIAPAGLEFYAHRAIPEWRNTLLLTTLKECNLRALRLNDAGDSVRSERVWADRLLGRLRDVCVAPNGDVYLATSNRDWNPTCEGFPKPTDDRIVRLRRLRTLSRREQAERRKRQPLQLARVDPGRLVYDQYCAACHKPQGEGLPGTYPPLAGSEWMKGSPAKMAALVLDGLSGPIMVKGQPYNELMPPLRFLTDQQIADVLTYTRQSFGNRESSITFRDVATVRAKKAVGAVK